MKTKSKIVLYIALIVLASLFVSTVSAADGVAPEAAYVSFNSGAVDLPIPDGGYDGSLGSMACSGIDTSGTISPGTAVRNLRFKMKVSHTWVGDLVFKIQSPSTTILGLMSRPGGDEPDDGATGFCCGTNSDLDGSPIRFRDFGVKDAELMGDEGTIVTARDYFPNPGMIGGPDIPGMRGEEASGVWSFCVGDGAGADTGMLHAWVLMIGVP